MKGWTVTVRHGPEVIRERFDSLEQAVETLRDRAEAIQAEGPLQNVRSLRDFEPAQQVHARLEISGGGVLRSRDAGVDVMGDGSLVPYTGAIRRRELELRGGQTAFEAIGEALAERDDET